VRLPNPKPCSLRVKAVVNDKPSGPISFSTLGKHAPTSAQSVSPRAGVQGTKRRLNDRCRSMIEGRVYTVKHAPFICLQRGEGGTSSYLPYATPVSTTCRGVAPAENVGDVTQELLDCYQRRRARQRECELSVPLAGISRGKCRLAQQRYHVRSNRRAESGPNRVGRDWHRHPVARDGPSGGRSVLTRDRGTQ